MYDPSDVVVTTTDNSRKAARPKVAEILAHPAYPTTTWNLKPVREGLLSVAAGRGGPFNISWEIHGTGEIKLVWVMGMGSIKSAWQRQILRFGHEMGDQYSCLIFDSRGIGASDKPLIRYSTSEMARDTLEILNHVGWTEERQLHVIGLSMGGMISQELALLIPNRICSLNLVSTAARIENTTTFFANLRTRINMFIPKSLDRSVADAGAAMFAAAWLDAPDDTHLPDLSTPGVLPPAVPSTSPNSGYGRFETNYQRYAALELTKRLNPEVFERKGFLLQVLATGFHHKSAEQLKRLADEVGRERILVMHGTEDNMLTVHHGRVLIRELNPSTHSIGEGIGHLFMMEKTAWFHDTLEDMFARAEKLVAK